MADWGESTQGLLPTYTLYTNDTYMKSEQYPSNDTEGCMRRIVVTEQILEEQLPAETIRNIKFAISTMKCVKKPTITEFINSLIDISEKYSLN